MNEILVIGKIRTTHGVKGCLKVFSFSGEYSHFHDLKEVNLRLNRKTLSFEVESVKPFGAEILLKLKGIDSPEEGRKLANAEIVVSREFAAPLDSDEYYLADLVGLELHNGGKAVGKVKSVCEGGGGNLLEVRLKNGSMVYIPFRSEFIGEIDVNVKGIELTADWLLE